MERKIIIIGMDNSGKTTLAENLKALKGWEIIKSKGPKLSKEEMIKTMLDNLEKKDVCILERFAIFEEIVYGKELRGTSKFDFKDVKPLIKYNPFIIYCRPSKKDILDFKDREQMEGVIDNSEKLLKRWDRVYKKLKKNGFTVKKYNFKKDKDFEELLEGF